MRVNETIDFPITDGFLYNTNLRANMRFLALAINEYEALRRSSAFRSKLWLVPEDSQQAIVPAFDSYEYQVSCAPGSAIWGVRFTCPAGTSYSIKITDACTDVPLFSEEVSMNQQPTDADGSRPFSSLLIVPNGLLNVIICNVDGTLNNNVQLVLYGGEPVCEAA